MKPDQQDLDRAAVRAALQAIADANNRVLNPQQVVEAARDPQSVLHSFFDWDDSHAAEAYRLAQAHALVRRVKVNVVRTDATTREIRVTSTRAFQSRPSMRTGTGGYEGIADILGDETKRRELLALVLSELLVYRQRYADLSELEAVWTAVDEIDIQVGDTSPSSAPDGETRPGAAG